MTGTNRRIRKNRKQQQPRGSSLSITLMTFVLNISGVRKSTLWKITQGSRTSEMQEISILRDLIMVLNYPLKQLYRTNIRILLTYNIRR